MGSFITTFHSFLLFYIAFPSRLLQCPSSFLVKSPVLENLYPLSMYLCSLARSAKFPSPATCYTLVYEMVHLHF